MSGPPSSKASPDELTPLALMLALMRQKWNEGDQDGAVKLACAAAPYLHARRSTAGATARIEAHRLSDADLCRALAELERGTPPAAADP